LHFPDLQR